MSVLRCIGRATLGPRAWLVLVLALAPVACDPSDDATTKDTDNDGLSDDQETAIGSDPNDADSDDDGLIDGQERNPADDGDGDGIKNVLDPDSDDDGLFDGTSGITGDRQIHTSTRHTRGPTSSHPNG